MEIPVSRINKVNITRVLRTIWLEEGISRVALADALGLNKSTVSNIVHKLESLGIVEPMSIGSAGPSGGRRPIHLRIKPDWGCVMGIEIQTEAFTVLGVNLKGELCFSFSEPIDVRKKGLLCTATSIIRRFSRELERKGKSLMGIGIGLPGFVNPAKGILQASLPLRIFEPLHLASKAARLLGVNIPILIDNDANCGCWGELTSTSTGKPDDFLFALGEFRKHTVEMDDTRIMALGFGFVLNGSVHHGAGFSAGEYRSIYFSPEHTNQLSLSDDEAKLFLKDQEVNRKVIDELSRHIAFLVHILNLKKVIIGGPIEVLSKDISEVLQCRLQESWQYPDTPVCEIRSSQMGELAVAYGAARMFLEHLITVPALTSLPDTPPCGADLLVYLESVQRT